jgi:hypothetical protein
MIVSSDSGRDPSILTFRSAPTQLQKTLSDPPLHGFLIRAAQEIDKVTVWITS